MSLRSAPTPVLRQSPFDRSAQHETKRTAILSQAARLFNSRGSRSTTLSDIAQSLGLTKTSLYYYVKTKEALIYQCYLATIARHQQVLRELSQQKLSGLQRVEGFIRSHLADRIAALRGTAPHYAALLEIASLQEQHRQEVEQRYIDLFRALRQCLRDGMQDGSVRPCETTAATLALLGSLDWSFDWIRRLPTEQLPTVANHVWQVFSEGLASPGNATLLLPTQIPVGATPIQAGFDREQQRQQKQAAFFQAGTWFFNRQGFNGTSLDEIAEQLSVTKGAFYYHIRNKEDLLFECYRRSLDLVAEVHREAAQCTLGLHRLAHTCHRVFALQNSEAGPLIRYTSIMSLPLERRLQILERTEINNHCFAQFIQDGVGDGSVKAVNPVIAEHLLAGAINASMDMHLWRPVDDLKQAAAEYFSVFFDGLAVKDNSA